MKAENVSFGIKALTAGRKNTPAADAKKDFAGWLSDKLGKVDRIQKQADAAARDLIVGRSQDLHETMLSIQKAEISFRLLMEVRNKLISAYEEIQRMQF